MYCTCISQRITRKASKCASEMFRRKRKVLEKFCCFAAVGNVPPVYGTTVALKARRNCWRKVGRIQHPKWRPEKFVVHVLSAHLSAATKLPSLCPKSVVCYHDGPTQKSEKWPSKSRLSSQSRRRRSQQWDPAFRLVVRKVGTPVAAKVGASTESGGTMDHHSIRLRSATSWYGP